MRYPNERRRKKSPRVGAAMAQGPSRTEDLRVRDSQPDPRLPIRGHSDDPTTTPADRPTKTVIAETAGRFIKHKALLKARREAREERVVEYWITSESGEVYEHMYRDRPGDKWSGVTHNEVE